MYMVHATDENGCPIDILVTSSAISDVIREECARLGWTILGTAPVITLPQLAVRRPAARQQREESVLG